MALGPGNWLPDGLIFSALPLRVHIKKCLEKSAGSNKRIIFVED